MASPSDAVETRDPSITTALWDSIAPLRDRIDSLEFLHRLGDGTLPIEAFDRYIAQDAIYLRGYARALALLAVRASDPDAAVFWASAAAQAITVESQLHAELLSKDASGQGDSFDIADLPEPTPTCLGYVSYLIATVATEPYAVGAAAVLPCFWIYADVGTSLARRAHDVLAADPDHPYAKWVATYGDPAFGEQAAAARRLVDRAAAEAGAAERAAMTTAFVTASRYELAFWDTALYPQPWTSGHGVDAAVTS
ncbi:TenA family protein [Millisia brevis]|uniref:TenA family protein n=1 Tax=Millisia brevis TaxID=264148 RepID=UPI000836BAC2|nr:TenA family protein [Millisia brevis]